MKKFYMKKKERVMSDIAKRVAVWLKKYRAAAVDAGSKLKSQKDIREYFICAYLVAFLFLYIFYSSLIFSALAAFGVIFTIKTYERKQEEKRRAFLKLQFRDLLYSMSASYAAGRQLGEALSEGYESLGLLYGVDTPMMKELEFMKKSINENHSDECAVLLDFAQRSGVEDIGDFADIYSTCRATGGSIERIIDKTALVLIEKLTIEREIHMLMAQKKLEGMIIFFMPVIVIFLLNFVSPDYLAVLYESMAGRVVMTVGLAGMLYAGVKIKSISDVKI